MGDPVFCSCACCGTLISLLGFTRRPEKQKILTLTCSLFDFAARIEIAGQTRDWPWFRSLCSLVPLDSSMCHDPRGIRHAGQMAMWPLVTSTRHLTHSRKTSNRTLIVSRSSHVMLSLAKTCRPCKHLRHLRERKHQEIISISNKSLRLSSAPLSICHLVWVRLMEDRAECLGDSPGATVS